MADQRSYFQGLDLDSGVGSDLVLGVNLRRTASGGSAEVLGQQLAAASLPVVLASDQGAVPTEPAAPTSPVLDPQTSGSLAAGSTATLTSTEAPTTRCTKILVWASVPFKYQVFTVDNTVESSVKGYGGGGAFQQAEFVLPHPDYLKLGATAGTDAYRVKITNLDDANAADVYATFMYEAQ